MRRYYLLFVTNTRQTNVDELGHVFHIFKPMQSFHFILINKHNQKPTDMFKYFKVRNFCGILISRGFLTILEIRGIFNFAVQPKYYILEHFNSCFDQNTIVCDILVLAVLKIEFFMCVSCQHFSNSGKSRNLNANLIHFYHFFTHCWFTKVLKTPE